MELLYLWIEDYKNIKQQGFNFSPLYDFHFEPDKPDENGKIVGGTLTDKITEEDRKKKRDFYKDFFGKGISNVTAIVGENGAGKSNLLEYLFKREGSFIDLLILEEDEKIIIKHDEGLQINFSLNNLNFESIGIPIDYLIYPTGFDTPLCYLSTIFDNRILNNGDRHAYGDVNLERLDSNYLALAGDHTHLDTQIQLQFLNSNYKSSIPIKNIPKRLFINVTSPNASNSMLGDSQDEQALESFITLTEDVFSIRENFSSVKRRDIFINQLYFMVCFIYCDSSAYSFLLVINKEDINKGGEYCFKKLQKVFRKNNKELNHFSKKVKELVHFFNTYDITFLDNNASISLESIPKLYDIDILFEKDFSTIFSFYWTGLSSGEMFFLTVCSRIHYFITKKREEAPKNYTLIIDEGELGLHPHWQKKYLNHIINFLNEFKDKQIQLILTSHSPFLVSDLPKENVIFLEKEDTTGLCKVSKLDSMKHTFGANIHTLLTDSFFMKGGLVGEFAQSKIDEVIKLLDKPKLNEKETEHCEMIIAMIGEPIVKTMLQKLLDSKRLRKVDEHTSEIEKLRKRIEELENNNNSADS